MLLLRNSLGFNLYFKECLKLLTFVNFGKNSLFLINSWRDNFQQQIYLGNHFLFSRKHTKNTSKKLFYLKMTMEVQPPRAPKLYNTGIGHI